jgi:hypothetical protein
LPFAERRRRVRLAEDEVGMGRWGTKDLAGERLRRFFLCGQRRDRVRCGGLAAAGSSASPDSRRTAWRCYVRNPFVDDRSD